MEPFFMYVSIGALALFIIILIVVGVGLSRLQSMDSFPPTQNACPDHWDVSSNPMYCGIPASSAHSNMKNIGNIQYNSNGIVDSSKDMNIGFCNAKKKFGCDTNLYFDLKSLDSNQKFQYVKLNDETGWNKLYPGLSERCAKRRWAQTMNISWDGVSNFNGC